MNEIEELKFRRDKCLALHAFYQANDKETDPLWARSFKENRLRWLLFERELQQHRLRGVKAGGASSW